MYALFSPSRSAARLAARSSKIASAAFAALEALESRSLLSDGDVLHTEVTNIQDNSDTGGAIVRVADQKLLQVGLSFDAGFNQVTSALVSGGTAVLHNYTRAIEIAPSVWRRPVTLVRSMGIGGKPSLARSAFTPAWMTSIFTGLSG